MMEDPIDRTFEYSGIFESDYLEGCKFLSIAPFNLSKICLNKDFSRTMSSPKFPPIKKNDSGDLLVTSDDFNSKCADQKFRFTRKINLMIDEDDELAGIQLRGWQIPMKMTDVLVNSILASSNIGSLCLSNCGLNDQQANALLQINNSNVRDLFIDQNPGISETLFAAFIGEDSNLKIMSARSNNISDAGAKAIAAALKVNRTLTILNLWDNHIRRDGAEAIADGLRSNQCLLSLSLGKNYIDDAAVSAFGKILSNQILTPEEVQIRRKVIAEWEKRREIEDKQRKGGSSATKAAGKISGKQEDAKKQAPVALQKGAKKLDTQKSPKSPDKKSFIDEKPKLKDSKKGTASSAASPRGLLKLSAADDAFSSAISLAPEPQPYAEPMYEINGQWYNLGNRTIYNIDFSSNEITEIGLKALLDAVTIQEMTNEIASPSDELIGLYRVSLNRNKFASSDPNLIALNNILNKRNPFYTDEDMNNENSKPNEDNEDDRPKDIPA